MPNVIAEGVVKLTASGGPMGAAISQELAKLRAPLGQVKAAGESSATSIGSSFTKAGGMIAAGMAVAGAAAVGFALKSASVFKDVGGEVLKVQRYMGGSAEAASKWRFVAQQSGVDTDKFAKSMLGLSKAVENNNPALEKYGIATLDAKGKTLGLDQILLNVADKFKSMPSGIDKNTLASDLFGKKLGGDLIPMLNKGRAGLEALEKQAQKYGLVLSTSNLAAIKASTVATRKQSAAWQGLQVQIGSNVLPLTTKLTTAFTEGLVKVMPLISSGMNTLVIPAFSALTSVLGGTVSFIGAHQGLVKGLAVVIGAALVPAVVAWGVAQAVVLAE
ncbi:MAG: hypothetical protein QOK36_4399, partial [Gaiellales bacterium]|nr:hypothetical protein [Gaiellales bacterium]